jgi:hypothetical protein
MHVDETYHANCQEANTNDDRKVWMENLFMAYANIGCDLHFPVNFYY